MASDEVQRERPLQTSLITQGQGAFYSVKYLLKSHPCFACFQTFYVSVLYWQTIENYTKTILKTAVAKFIKCVYLKSFNVVASQLSTCIPLTFKKKLIFIL